MNLSKAGLELIKSSEGLRMAAYLCPAGVPTIGYGSTGPNVKLGLTISALEAEALLLRDLRRFEGAVRREALPASQGEYDALVSLAFNIGIEAFARSTLLRLHRAGDHRGAADQFLRWNKARGRVLPGLARRRAAERALYLS
jgi:lysozyme